MTNDHEEPPIDTRPAQAHNRGGGKGGPPHSTVHFLGRRNGLCLQASP